MLQKGLRFIMVIFLGVLVFACRNSKDDFKLHEQGEMMKNVNSPDSVDFSYLGEKVNISTSANANYFGLLDPLHIIDIAGVNNSYCHPDILYFENGFQGYKYWMVFTPYFGTVGVTQVSKKFENPTIVVSNDAINWVEPKGIKNPLISPPLSKLCFRENNVDPKQGFWSDVDWVYVNKQFFLYYRGSFILPKFFLDRGVKEKSSLEKLSKKANRTIVQQKSMDGIHWNSFEIALTSNAPITPQNNYLLSPTFIHDGKQFISYEVELNIDGSLKNSTVPSYILRRTSNDGLNFDHLKQSKVVRFLNKPWLSLNPKYGPWHIQAAYVDGYYFMYIAVGDAKVYNCEALYLAYSKDGINFQCFPQPVMKENAYRSAVFPKSFTSKSITLGAMIANKKGEFYYREYVLSKPKMDAELGQIDIL